MFNLNKIQITFFLLLSSAYSFAGSNLEPTFHFQYVAAALILGGFLLILFEMLLTAFGVLGILGTMLLCFGLYKMLNPDSALYHLSLMIVVAFGVIAVILFLLFGWFYIRLRRKKVVTGQEELIGAVGEITSRKHGTMALIHSELWQVESDVELHVGQKVEVIARQGLILVVRPIEEKK